MDADNPAYQYSAVVYDVYDGDTIKASVDLGFSIAQRMTLRLYGIDAPEVRGPERPDGLTARDWLRQRVLDQPVILRTYQDRKGKYGRYLATVYHAGRNINIELVKLGLAVEVTY